MTTESTAYGRAYYETYCGEAYERTPTWLTLFGHFASRIVSDIGPSSVLDAGCAMGFLVEALRDRGVDAQGIDISEYAISQGRDDVREHLRVGSLLEPLDGRWDLITCIEVIEHLEPGDAEIAVANLCAASDDILLSSTPHVYTEATHINVRPPEHWVSLFLRHGFVRDVRFDASFLTTWAMRLRRRRDPLERTVIDYDSRLWQLLEEKGERDRLILEQSASIAAFEQERQSFEAQRNILIAEAGRLGLDLRDCDSQLRRALNDVEDLKDEVRQVEARWGELNHRHEQLRHSTTFRMAERVRNAVRTAAPAGTPRGDALTRSVRQLASLRREGPAAIVARRQQARVSTQRLPIATPRLPESDTAAIPELHEVDRQWNEFLAANRPDAATLHRMRNQSRAWPRQPVVSILMPTYDPEPWFLRAAIDSVRAQAYEAWELCIADDHSPGSAAVDTVAEYAHDTRVKFVRRDVNGGIAAASMTAASIATGEFIGLLDHDDTLTPDALFQEVRHLLTHPADEMVYSDEDKLDAHGRHVGAHLKPDWSPELLDCCNYICHFTIMRRDLFDRIGGFRPGFDGSQDYDLILRATEAATGVGHVREVLYNWRMLPRSAAASTDAKPEAYAAGKRALESAQERRGDRGWVDEGPGKGFYYVRRAVVGEPTVAAIIPTRDRVEMLRRAVQLVERESSPRDVRIVIVDNDSVQEATRGYLERSRHLVVACPGAFNFSRLVNRGVEAAGPVDHVLLLNNDITAGTAGWIDAMLEHSQRDGVGAVGCRLLFEDGEVQAEGIRVGGQGVPCDHLDLSHYFGMGRCTRTVSAVSGAAMMVKRSAWEAAGGYDEELRVIYNDVDFCLRLARQHGLRNVYTPVAELTHAHSASRGGHHPSEDERIFLERWDPIHQGWDPFVGGHIWSFMPLSYR